MKKLNHLDFSFRGFKSIREGKTNSDKILMTTEYMSILGQAIKGDEYILEVIREAKPELTIKDLQQKYLNFMKRFIVAHEDAYKGTEFDQRRNGSRRERLQGWLKDSPEHLKILQL